MFFLVPTTSLPCNDNEDATFQCANYIKDFDICHQTSGVGLTLATTRCQKSCGLCSSGKHISDSRNLYKNYYMYFFHVQFAFSSKLINEKKALILLIFINSFIVDKYIVVRSYLKYI